MARDNEPMLLKDGTLEGEWQEIETRIGLRVCRPPSNVREGRSVNKECFL